MKNNSNHVSISTYSIIIAVILGGFLGHFAPGFSIHLKIIGDIFLNILFVLVIPLIISSMISGISGLGDVRHLGSLGLKTIIFYISTTFMAVLIGIILVNIIEPGKNVNVIQNEFPDTAYIIEEMPLSGGSVISFQSSAGDIPANIQPENQTIELTDQNIIGIMDPESELIDSVISVDKWIDNSGKNIEPRRSGTGIFIRTIDRRLSSDEILNNFIPRNVFRSMVDENVFPLIIFCLFFGAVLTTIGDAGKPLLDIINAINITIIKCVVLAMYLAPVGILCLIAARIGEAELTIEGGLAAELSRLAKYTFTVALGLIIHACITLVLILRFVGKRNPFVFFKNLIPQLLTAFSTASSMATLPVTISLAVEKNKISKKIAGFVLPLGATVNMDGTALYEGVAAIFIAQLYNIQLGFGEQLIILITATVAAIGAAAIPHAGLVTMVLVLRSVGLPLEGIGVILTIDWFLDRMRTTVNSWGDSVGAAVIECLEGDNLNGN
ncbi:dicarboxylate/amino acid:cation symporter [Candidatus Latescibacterota bacterium]